MALKVGIKSHQILANLPPRQSLARWRMRPIQFEKATIYITSVHSILFPPVCIFTFSLCYRHTQDDDRNFHVDFIWSAANIRAISYGIKPIERLEAKIIAGS